MKCKKLEKIDLYFEKKLNDQERAYISKHLETCGDCHGYLNDLKRTDQVIAQLKSFNPELTDPAAFRNEVLRNVNPNRRTVLQNALDHMVENLISILVMPTTKYAFVAAAIVFFGLFAYQQSTIVQKMDALEKRMESKMATENLPASGRLDLEAFFKKKKAKMTGESQTDNLLNDYRYLQLKYAILLKVLKERHPDTYREFIQKVEKETQLPTNKSNDHENL